MKSNRTIKGYLVLVLLLFSGASVAQGAAEEKPRKASYLERQADACFLRHKFDKAMSLYELAAQREPRNVTMLHLKMARLYFMLRQYARAADCYNKVVEKDKDLPTIDDVCDFMDAYRFTGEEQKAEAVCLTYHYKEVYSRHQRYQNTLDVLAKRYDMVGESNYTLQPLASNSRDAEYLVSDFDGEQFFVRSRSHFNPPGKLFFHRTRYYALKETGENDSRSREQDIPFRVVPRDLQGGSASFSPERGIMVTAILEYEKPGRIRLGERPFKSKLVCSRFDKKGQRYSRFEMLFAQDQEASFTHPFFFNDGRSLLFSSDMPGGHGGFDLHVIHWDEARQAWGAPVNLGAAVNTEGDEIFPVLFHDKLLFASNGHSGFGGYDLFGVAYNGGVVSSFHHFPYPINSVFNDFYMYPVEATAGYIISDRDGKTRDDIYRYQFKATNLADNIPWLDATEQSLMNQRVSPETIQVNTRVPSLSLYFDFDRAELTPWAFRSLKGFVEACGDNRSFHLEILGYADAVGSDDYNRHLSRKRADTVARRLRESGIEVPMKAEGRGKLPRSGENGGMLTNESARRVEIYKLEAK